MADAPAAGLVVQVMGRQHGDAFRHAMNLDPAAGMAQPEAIPAVGDDHVEGAVGLGVELGEGPGRDVRVGVLEGLQHQFAPLRLPGLGPRLALRFMIPATTPSSLMPEPASAGQLVQPGDHLGPVRPVARGRTPGPGGHLVAVGAENDGPVMAGPAQDDDAAHEAFLCGLASLVQKPRATRYNQGRIYRQEPRGAQAPMATFDDREKGFEGKFAHDQEVAFKAKARRDKLIARWLAPQLQLSQAETEEYGKSLASHAYEKNHEDALVKRIMADCAAKGVRDDRAPVAQASGRAAGRGPPAGDRRDEALSPQPFPNTRLNISSTRLVW